MKIVSIFIDNTSEDLKKKKKRCYRGGELIALVAESKSPPSDCFASCISTSWKVSPPAERTEEEAARRSRGYIVMARHPSVIRDVLELLKSFRLDLSGSFGLLAEQTTNLNESILDVFDNYELFDSYDLLPAQEHKGTWVNNFNMYFKLRANINFLK